MPNTQYSDLCDINKLQRNIMIFIGEWVHVKKTPIPRKEIISRMVKDGIKDFTTVNAINSLLTKGYIRRAEVISNETFYVQIRTV